LRKFLRGLFHAGQIDIAQRNDVFGADFLDVGGPFSAATDARDIEFLAGTELARRADRLGLRP
jgi:hypothetical protein